MEDGLGFLRKVRQDYIQYNVAWPINMSGSAYRFRDEGLPYDESLMIYKGWAPTIEISSCAEYERFKKVNGGSDYREDDKKLLFCIEDEDVIADVVEAVDSYYITAQYEQCLDDLIAALEPKLKLELKK